MRAERFYKKMSRPEKGSSQKKKPGWVKALGILALLIGVAIFLVTILFVSQLLEARSSEKRQQEVKLQPQEKIDWSGSLISPLHRIPLQDEFNQKIIPAASDSLPFSARYSCEPCHSYETISQGTHFNFKQRPPVDRRTEPWFLVDEKTGVQLPVSFQNYPGLWSTEKLGMSDWQFMVFFGRNLNGGGPGEPGEDAETLDSRWNVSGKLEINCLGCHNSSPLQDHSEWVVQVMRENFRWAATAASGLGEVIGMASRLPPTWSIIDGPNPDNHEWAIVPQVKYNQNLFDNNNNAVLDLTQPLDSRCLACHSVSPRKARSKAEIDRDVHLIAGLRCVDCHRNDLSHEMIRGFEGEKLSRSKLQAEDFTCASCHLGEKPEKGGFGFSGKLGAPRPAHKGIPKVHFERLSCTTCHSGLLPEKEPQKIYTSRANRLGIFGKAIWTSEYPVIEEPVFVREKDKKIYPERMMWPAFWAEKKGQELIPIDSQEVLRVCPEVFNLKKSVANLLNCLLPLADEGYYPAVIISEFLFEPNVDGSLDVRLLENNSLSGNEDQKKFILVQIKEDQVKLLLPIFDPEEAPPGVEDEILLVLQSLKPLSENLQPIFLTGKYAYKITKGYLEKIEKSGEPVPEPEIGWLEAEEFRPLLSEFQVQNLAVLGSGSEILTEDQLRLVLKKFSEVYPEREFAYISGGFVFSLNQDQKLQARQHPAASPVSWPLAHNVRPAQQALGKNGCGDCHSTGSTVFFGRVEASSPLKTYYKESKLQTDFMKTGSLFQFLFGATFLVRPTLKLVLAACLLIIGLLLLAVIIRFAGKASGISDDDSSSGPRR